MRGSDKFEDVDELYIIGRQFLKVYEYENLARGVFDIDVNICQEWIDTPVRMKNGNTKSIHNKRFIQNELELVKHHFGDSETVQAIGRGRLIHGKSKDVYVLSNEVLQGVEIADFISEDEMMPKLRYGVEIEQAIEQGYCKFSNIELMKLGFSEHHVKSNKSKISDELLDTEFEYYKFDLITKNRKIKSVEYFILDDDKFKTHLQSIGASIV